MTTGAPVALALTIAATPALHAQPPDSYQEDLGASAPIREEQYRQLDQYVKGLLDAAVQQPGFTPDYSSEAAYLASAEPLRDALKRALGYPPPGVVAESTVRLEKVGEDAEAVYHRMWVDSLTGVQTYGLYLVPKGVALPAPLIIAQHGGGGYPELATFHGGANYHDLVMGAVREGYVVWAPLCLFKSADAIPDDARPRLDQRARLAGTTLTAIEVAKITRALDEVLKRPEVDPTRVGMVGLSYGGFYTLYVTALEPRIKAAVSSCFFNDRQPVLEASQPFGWSDMQFPGGLAAIRDPQLAALICPRPLQVQVGSADDLFPVEGARRTAPLARAYYEQLGLADRFEYVEFEGGHEFRGDVAWAFLRRHLAN